MLRVGQGRIPDQDDHRLPAQVDALVVVPAELRRLDAVAHEDELRGVHRHALARALRPGDVVVAPGEPSFLGPLPERQRGAPLHGGADERDLLDPRAVGVARLEADRLQLIDEVRDRQLLALRAGGTALEGVGREQLRVLENGRSVDGGERGLGGAGREGVRAEERGREAEDQGAVSGHVSLRGPSFTERSPP